MQKNTGHNLIQFMMKTRDKPEIKGNFLNLVQGTPKKCTANSYLMVKDNVFSLKSGTRQGRWL